MAEPTRHSIIFDLPIYVGSSEDADTMHVKVLAVYNRTADPNPMLNVIEAKIYFDESNISLLERVQDYFDDEGYDMALEHAKHSGPGDWE